MRKILLALFLGITSIICNAQIYNTIEHYDRFDDCIKKEKLKTIIDIDEYDNTISIETKGRNKALYYVFHTTKFGEKDDIVDITGTGVYGYDNSYFCVQNKDLELYTKLLAKKRDELGLEEGSQENYQASLEIVLSFLNGSKETYFIKCFVDRTIMTQYAKMYLGRLCWLQNNNGSRVIYKNQ